jgi:mono/diheme cytochrome c family protein
MMLKPTRFILSVALLAAVPALAQVYPGDPVAGRNFARQGCAVCHFVESEDLGLSWSGAPAFQEVADDPAVTEISLRIFLRTPHEDMPNFMLTPSETDDVISYILSLK